MDGLPILFGWGGHLAGIEILLGGIFGWAGHLVGFLHVCLGIRFGLVGLGL